VRLPLGHHPRRLPVPDAALAIAVATHEVAGRRKERFIKQLPPHTPAGVDYTTHSSSLLCGRRRQ
jgi:hypothetical protein